MKLIICETKKHIVTAQQWQLSADVKWLITGTPIQNHINDLYSLFDIIGISRKVYTNTDKLRTIMKTIVLKRTKKDVGIKLPAVHTTRVRTMWKNANEQKLTESVHNNIGLDRKMLLAMMMYERMMCVYPTFDERCKYENHSSNGGRKGFC